MPQIPANIHDALLALLHPYRPGLTAESLSGWLERLPRRGPAPSPGVTTGEAAKMYNLTPRTVRRKIVEAGVKPVAFGRMRGHFKTPLYSLSDLERAL